VAEREPTAFPCENSFSLCERAGGSLTGSQQAANAGPLRASSGTTGPRFTPEGTLFERCSVNAQTEDPL